MKGVIDTIELVPLNLPMRQPFVTALGRKSVSRNLLVRVQLANGIAGYGEASASLAWPGETQPAMTRAVRKIVPSLNGRPIDAYRRLIDVEVW